MATGSNFGTNTTVSPANRPISAAHCALPWMSGAGQRFAGEEVDAAAKGPPDVLLSPEHALGVSGRSACVEQVNVIAAARLEVAVCRLGRQGGVVRDAEDLALRGRAVVDDD